MVNYNNIIKKINTQLKEKGRDIDWINGLFRKANNNEKEILLNLFTKIKEKNNSYTGLELKDIEKYRLPKNIEFFYKEFTPSEIISLEGYVRLLNLEQIIIENSELTPGALLIKYGFITFATTIGGNAICIDLNNINNDDAQILLADHSIFYDKEFSIYKMGKLIDYSLSYETIKKLSGVICNSFFQFIEMLANREIENIEEYL